MVSDTAVVSSASVTSSSVSVVSASVTASVATAFVTAGFSAIFILIFSSVPHHVKTVPASTAAIIITPA